MRIARQLGRLRRRGLFGGSGSGRPQPQTAVRVVHVEPGIALQRLEPVPRIARELGQLTRVVPTVVGQVRDDAVVDPVTNASSHVAREPTPSQLGRDHPIGRAKATRRGSLCAPPFDERLCARLDVRDRCLYSGMYSCAGTS